MLETDRLPATFKIISEVPALQIKYCPDTHCGAIVLLPLPVLGFLYCSFLLLSTISSILAALYHGDWQIIEIYTHDIFEYIGVWLNFTFATCLFSFLVFGVTEFRACRKFLVVTNRFINIEVSRKIYVPVNTIKYFTQFSESLMAMDDTSTLAVVTNQRINDGAFILHRGGFDESGWLGRKLATFYKVEFRAGEKPTF
jgi:hypothetical protein